MGSRPNHIPALLIALLYGCSGDDPLPIESVRELKPIEFSEAIQGRDGGFSALFKGQSVWVFGDTALTIQGEDGSSWRHSTWSSTLDLDASDGLAPFFEPVDSLGAPYQLVRFTDQESAYNAARRPPLCKDDCEPAWVLWPGPFVVDPKSGRALLFYSKLLDWELAGFSLAVWEDPDSFPERRVLAPGTPEPTLMFPAGDVFLGTAALEVDGVMYAYGCQDRGLWNFPCIVGRAPMENALERSAWEFFDGDKWSPDASLARPVMRANSILNVHYNPYLAKYVALYVAPPEGEITLRRADAPEGPWSRGQVIHRALPPSGDGWIYDALAHPELSRQDGRIIYFTYSRETAPFQTEMHLVEVVFGETQESE